jgi:hypothetical protein
MSKIRWIRPYVIYFILLSEKEEEEEEEEEEGGRQDGVNCFSVFLPLGPAGPCRFA